MTPRFKIGQQFIKQGRKVKKTETIIDILTTTNNAGEVVKIRYMASHDFMGQAVIDYDVCDTAIARGLIKD